MDSVFTLFGASVTSFGIGCAAALLAALILTCLAGKKSQSYQTFIGFAVIALPLTLLFARVFYCAAEYAEMDTLARWLDVSHGGYSVMGAFAGLVLAAFLAEKLFRLEGHPLMNGLMVGAPAGLMIERLCEAGTGTGLGKELPEALYAIGVEDPDLGALVHPVYIYEAVFAVLLLIAGICILARCKGEFTGCDGLLTFMTLFGTSQVFLEAFRNDRHMYIHFVQVEQVIAIVISVIALAVWMVRWAKRGGNAGRLWLTGIIAVICIGLTVFMEFRLDRGSMKLLYYSVIAICMAVFAIISLGLKKACDRRED